FFRDLARLKQSAGLEHVVGADRAAGVEQSMRGVQACSTLGDTSANGRDKKIAAYRRSHLDVEFGNVFCTGQANQDGRAGVLPAYDQVLAIARALAMNDFAEGANIFGDAGETAQQRHLAEKLGETEESGRAQNHHKDGQ